MTQPSRQHVGPTDWMPKHGERSSKRARILSSSVVFGILLSSCNGLWPDTYWRAEDYVLIAVDTLEQMALAIDMGDGTSQGIVEPTVFAVGANEKYIVVKQHPRQNGTGLVDRSVTRYYVVTRSRSGVFEERQKGVRGPLTAAEFEVLRATQQLPAFSKTFADLE